jgi:hypothetical protein
MTVILAELLHSLLKFAINPQILVRESLFQLVVSLNALFAAPSLCLLARLDSEFDIFCHLSLQWFLFDCNWVSVQVFPVFIFGIDDVCFFIRLGLICKCRTNTICLSILINHSEPSVPP